MGFLDWLGVSTDHKGQHRAGKHSADKPKRIPKGKKKPPPTGTAKVKKK